MTFRAPVRLRGMASALEHQHTAPDIAALLFEDRLSLLIQRERAERESLRLHQRLRIAKLPLVACVEDLDTRITRGLDRSTPRRSTSSRYFSTSCVCWR